MTQNVTRKKYSSKQNVELRTAVKAQKVITPDFIKEQAKKYGRTPAAMRQKIVSIKGTRKKPEAEAVEVETKLVATKVKSIGISLKDLDANQASMLISKAGRGTVFDLVIRS